MEKFIIPDNDRFRMSATVKGNQPKWVIGNKFVKADYFGYESIVESLVATLEQYIVGFDYVDYFPCLIEVGGHTYTGCYSPNFLKEGESLIPVYRMLLRYFGSEERVYAKLKNGRDMVEMVIRVCGNVTGLDEWYIGQYFANIIQLDAIILNEDRHLNNICFIEDADGRFRGATVFDNGLGLLSDTYMYPFYGYIEQSMRRVKAKPFSTSFKKQLSYFSEFDKLRIDVYSFLTDLGTFTCDFKKKELVRAKTVLAKMLTDLAGVAYDPV